MDNIDKTFILSYPRTGSTALLDVYRLYLENTYPEEYLNMPSEPVEGDQFFNLNDYAGIRYPFHKFCEKHNFPKIESNNLLAYRESLDMNILGDSIFRAILSESYYAVKIFPQHIKIDSKYMKDVLLKHVSDGNNLVCLYRKNFLDTISSIITCTWSNDWVWSTKDRRVTITADMVKFYKLRPIRNVLNDFKIWYNTYLYLSENLKNIKLIAYEDIESFDSNLLFKLHSVETNFEIQPRVRLQHDREQQRLVAEKYKHMIDQVLTKEVMKELPINSSYEIIL